MTKHLKPQGSINSEALEQNTFSHPPKQEQRMGDQIIIPKLVEPEMEENTMRKVVSKNFNLEEMKNFLENLISFESEGI